MKSCTTLILPIVLLLVVGVGQAALAQDSKCDEARISDAIRNRQSVDWPGRRMEAYAHLREAGKAGLPGLTRALGHERVEVRQLALEIIVEIGADATDAVPAMIEAWKDKDKSFASSAVDAVSKIGAIAVPHLIRVLKEQPEDATVRINTAIVLGKIGPAAKASVPALIKALREDDVRQHAAIALGRIGPESEVAIPQLIKLLSTANDKNRQAAEFALGRIGAVAVPVLIETVQRGSDAASRNSAAIALGEIGADAKEAVPCLIIAMESKDTGNSAAEALGKIGPVEEATLHALTRALKNKDVCGAAAKALAEIGPSARGAVPALVGLLQSDRDYHDRASAAYALGRIGPAAEFGVPALIDVIHDKSNLRFSAFFALGHIGPRAKAAIPQLIQALEKPGQDYDVALALSGIGPPAVPALIKVLRHDNVVVRRSATYALSKIGPGAKDAVKALIHVTQDEDRIVRAYAIRTLGKIGVSKNEQTDVVRTVIAALADKDVFVRKTAAQAIGDIGPPAAKAASALVEMLKDEDESVAIAAASALGKLGSEKVAPVVVPALADMLRNEDRDVCRYVAYALGELGPPAKNALPDLMTARATGDWLLSEAVEDAIEAIQSGAQSKKQETK